MKRKSPRSLSKDHVTWMPFTDMLSSTLMITFLFIAVSAILRAMNTKPPVIKLEDAEHYRFSTGSFDVSKDFKRALIDSAVPEIRKTINCFGVDLIEIIGHTDGRPGYPSGNLDTALKRAFYSSDMGGMVPGSNFDLGFLRAMAVQKEIQSNLASLGVANVGFRVLSAGSTVDSNGKFVPADDVDDKSRRRIEIRFLRESKTPFIPSCSL